jgi:hypothetical protein
MTPVTKTQVYFSDEQLEALHRVAKREKRSVAELIREAVGRVWLRPEDRGPVALWDKRARRTSVEHDSIYDEP